MEVMVNNLQYLNNRTIKCSVLRICYFYLICLFSSEFGDWCNGVFVAEFYYYFFSWTFSQTVDITCIRSILKISVS